jgi:quinol monooxygenase YgiN
LNAAHQSLDMSDPELILVADVHGRAGLIAELRALLTELVDGALGEAGCQNFRVLAADDPGEFVLLTSRTSENALRAHYDTPHYRRYREHVGPLLARPSDVVVHHLAATVHALDPNPPDPGKWDDWHPSREQTPL